MGSSIRGHPSAVILQGSDLVAYMAAGGEIAVPLPYDGAWKVEWLNPYTEPPGPRVLAERVIPNWPGAPDHDMPADLVEMARAHPGYSVTWAFRPTQPRRQWSKEAKVRERVRRLRERMERKYPLFAKLFIAEAMARKPDYYRAEDPYYDAPDEGEGGEMDEQRYTPEQVG